MRPCQPATPGAVASVVVPTRDRPADLEALLGALARSAAPFKVIVVDDGSEPAIGARALDGLAAGSLVRRQGGGAPARNARRRARRYLFTDDDAEPAEELSSSYGLDAHPEAVGVEGPIASPPFDPLYEHSLENDSPRRTGPATSPIGALPSTSGSAGSSTTSPTPLRGPRSGFRAAELGAIGFSDAMQIVHFPRPAAAARLDRAGAPDAQRGAAVRAPGSASALRPHAGTAVPDRLRRSTPGRASCASRARLPLAASARALRRGRDRTSAP